VNVRERRGIHSERERERKREKRERNSAFVHVLCVRYRGEREE